MDGSRSSASSPTRATMVCATRSGLPSMCRTRECWCGAAGRRRVWLQRAARLRSIPSITLSRPRPSAGHVRRTARHAGGPRIEAPEHARLRGDLHRAGLWYWSPAVHRRQPHIGVHQEASRAASRGWLRPTRSAPSPADTSDGSLHGCSTINRSAPAASSAGANRKPCA